MSKCDSCIHWWACEETGTGDCDSSSFDYYRHPAISEDEAKTFSLSED